MAIAGDIIESEAEIKFDPNFETELGMHSGSAEFTLPVAFRSELEGAQTLRLEVLYQVCDDRSCLPPKTKEITGEIVLSGIADNPFDNFPEETDEVVFSQQEDYELTSDAGAHPIMSGHFCGWQ
jgi:hypothetical protein